MLSSAGRGLGYLIQQQQASSFLLQQSAVGVLSDAASNTMSSLQQRWYIADPRKKPSSLPDHEPSLEDILFHDEGSGSSVAAHPGLKRDAQSSLQTSPVYTKEYMEAVLPIHRPIKSFSQRLGYSAVCAMRGPFNMFTGYSKGKMTDVKWLQRVIFMETVAGVPGMVGAMLRHMRSLRTMQNDQGWIHTLLEESENGRMHLLTFMQMRQPSSLMRATVLLTQGVVFNLYLLMYLISPKTSHAFAGYLAEEAVKTYTRLLQDIDAGLLWKDQAAPQISVDYWKLGPEANMRDLVLAARADVACHSHVNHVFSNMKPGDVNPFSAGGRSVLP